jgi:hypothetical protein
MGQARKRGTFEERGAAAINRRQAQHARGLIRVPSQKKKPSKLGALLDVIQK